MDTQIDRTILDHFNASPRSYLEPTGVDVKRLRDDRSEILPGDEVAFVATLTFRITQAGIAVLRSATKDSAIKDGRNDDLLEGLKHLAPDDALFAIGNDGEVVSTGLAINEASVAHWVADHYGFTFLLNGAPSHAFGPVQRARGKPDEPASGRRPLDLPWVQKLNTAALKDDYVDVDVRIGDAAVSHATGHAHPLRFELGHAVRELSGHTRLLAKLELRAPATVKLAGKTFVVPLAGAIADSLGDGDGDCNDALELYITISELETQKELPAATSAPPPPPAAQAETTHSRSHTRQSK